MPRYREVNPGLFAIVLFPFLFGVMYGDMLHGGILLCLSIGLCLMPPKTNASILHPLVPFRYLLLMMGIFSFYSGIIYNDCSSLTLNLFGSCYSPEKGFKCTYPFGLDPVWVVATNGLTFANSYKMKMAIIIGVCEMTFGLLLRGLNNLKDLAIIDLLCEFIPMLVLLSSAFGYMVLLIILKWMTDWTSNSANAPSIINQMISIPLNNGSVTGQALLGSPAFQQSVQQCIVLVVLFCVFMILVPKPVYHYVQMRSH